MSRAAAPYGGALAIERFWAKVDRNTGDCWIWIGARNSHGYGVFKVRSYVVTPAHRYAWEHVNGPIPEGSCVLHRCDNRPCVNPAHLFLGTQAENMRDMVSKGRQKHGPNQAKPLARRHVPQTAPWLSANVARTHCPNGHEYTAENTGRNNKSRKLCRTCARARSAEHRKTRRDAAAARSMRTA